MEDRLEFAHNLWATYLNKFFAPTNGKPDVEKATCLKVVELIWIYGEYFRPKMGLLNATAYSEAYNSDADGLLELLADKGDINIFDKASAGALRVLFERFVWSISALMIEADAGSSFTLTLPTDAPEHVRSLAALIFCLAGPGTDFPPLYSPKSPEISLGELSGQFPSWLH